MIPKSPIPESISGKGLGCFVLKALAARKGVDFPALPACEHPAHGEQRRAAIGLMPMRLYQCMLRAMYFPPRVGAAAAGSHGKTG